MSHSLSFITNHDDDRTGQIVAIEDPDATRYVWYAEVGEHETTIWANFHEADPTAELAGFHTTVLPMTAGAVGRLPLIDVKLNGVSA